MTASQEASASYRWVGLAGLVLVVSLVASILIAFGAPEAIRSDEKILDWYLDSTNQYRFVIGTMIGEIIGGTALLVFIIGFRRMLAGADAPDVLVELAYAAGLVFLAVLAVGAAIGSSIAATLIFSDNFQLDPDTARIVLTIGNIWIPAFAGIPGAVFLGVTSFACRRTGLLPTWLVWVGFVLTPLMLLAYPGFGINTYLVVVWILLASIVLLRRREAPVA
jgi:hypothetical protein